MSGMRLRVGRSWGRWGWRIYVDGTAAGLSGWADSWAEALAVGIVALEAATTLATDHERIRA